MGPERLGRTAGPLRQAPLAGPVVDLTALAGRDRAAARLGRAHPRPKVVVATQTGVVDPAVDEAGAWVPCVPVVAVVPRDPADLWHLAAAVASPVASAWMARRAAGTGLDRHALRISGPALSALPLPTAAAWDGAARALRDFAQRRATARSSCTPRPPAGRTAPAGLTGWWLERMCRR